MKFVETKDGSITVWNDKYGEHYHSISGALEEAIKKYFIPLDINDGMSVLDFCFGLGYNSAVIMHNCRNLSITALEDDIKIIEAISKIVVPDDYVLEFGILADLSNKSAITDKKNNHIKLILEDAKKAIYQLNSGSFDAIMFDPFSPSKQPELWTKEIFEQLYCLLRNGGKLATYSCAGHVRRSMKNVGFIVKDGPRVGRRSPSTVAVKSI